MDKLVLVIEDDNDKFKSIEYALKENGVTNIVRKTYRNAALRYLLDEGNSPDLVILDMQFPVYEDGGIDRRCGIRVLEMLAVHECNVPVVMCSSGSYDLPEGKGNVIGYILFDYSRDYTEHMAYYLDKIENDKDYRLNVLSVGEGE